MKTSLIVGLTMILMGSAFAQDTMRGIKDALARATVRICCGRTYTNVCEVGTAFMMLFKQSSGSPRSIPVFITNKHVVDKAQFVDFAFSGKWHSGAVPTAVTVRHIITKGEWRFHPDSDVDLCAMSIAPILNEIKARKYEIDIAPIPLSLLADDSILKLFHQLDEVVMIGYVSRALGRCVASFMLENRGDLDGKEQIEEVGWICQAAGMMHDMGNPPFGHAGEDAIRAWAANRHDDLEKVCEECTINDLLYFDGNAQAFRMASRPDMRESCYFRFTAATLGAMAKYPWPTNSERGMRERKSVAFSTEEKMLTQLLRKLGLNDDQRHPLSYVTEAADDICYRVCDFEDAVLMGLLDETEVKKMLLSGMTSKMQELHGNDSLSKVKALAIGDLIREFAKVYIDNYDAIISGNFEGKDLKSKIGGTWGEVLQQIKDRYDVIFSEHRKVVSEIGAYGQLSCLLDKYLEFLKFVKRHKVGGLLPEYKDLSFLCQRLVTLAWGGKAYYEINRTQTLDGLLHMIIDFVVGMTDDYLHKVAGEFV